MQLKVRALNLALFLRSGMAKGHNINNSETYSHNAHLKEGNRVSKKKKDSAPMPAASAGLLRFFEEETEGVKIRPELLVVLAVALIVVSVLAKVFFPV